MANISWAGVKGNGNLFGTTATNAMGGRGAIKYRDALTPRFTDRKGYINAGAPTGTPGQTSLGTTAAARAVAYDTYYAWGSVGSITRIGQY